MQNIQFSKRSTARNTSIEEGEFYRSLYENSLDAILLTAPDGRILAANPAACRMFDRTEEELKEIGRAGVVDLNDPRLADALQKRSKSGMIQEELTAIRRNGTKFAIEITSSVFKSQNGEVCTSMIIRDVSDRKRLEAQLHEQYERMGNLIENLPDAVYMLNIQERTPIIFNRKSFLGYNYEELKQSNYLLQQVHPEDTIGVAEYWAKILRGDEMDECEYRLQNKAGQWEWIDSRTATITHNQDGTPKEIVVILRVITDRKKAEEQIAYQAKVLENVNDVIIGTDDHFAITYWNPAAERIFGWKAEEVKGKSAAEVLRTSYPEEGRDESIREISKTGIWKGEVTQYTKDGRAVRIDANIMTIKSPEGNVLGYVSANRDISVRKQAEERLFQAKLEVEEANLELQEALKREQTLARIDGLTGLFNRRHFFLLAEQEFTVARRYQSPISIIIYDIDHFKLVNDRWGHSMGDEVLKHISRISSEQVRGADVLARYGGEEFIILLPNSNADEAANVAERIRRNVMSFRIDPEKTQAGITVSMGIAEINEHIQSLDHLIRLADQALYDAKNSGRNCIRVYRWKTL